MLNQKHNKGGLLKKEPGSYGTNAGVRVFLCSFALIALSTTDLKADMMAYASLLVPTVANEFGTIDLTTGQFTSINNSEPNFLNLAAFGGTLYGASEAFGIPGQGNLYSVNPTNGDLSVVGPLFSVPNEGVANLGSTTTGLYGLDGSLNLVSIDPTTGAATVIGPTGAPGFYNWASLSNNGTTLYLTDENNLYTIDTTTGAATLVGGLGPSQDGALLFDNGTLYGGEVGPLAIATIDTSTGAATTGPAISPSAFTYGLAPDPLTPPTTTTPEPESIVLLVTALLGACMIRFKARRGPATTK